jgi:hypothetical protein
MSQSSISLISADEVAFFQREGYLTLRAEQHGLVNPAELQKWTDEVLHWPHDREKWMQYDEINTYGERQIMRTEKIIDYYPQFRELLCGNALLTLLRGLTGKVVYSLNVPRTHVNS